MASPALCVAPRIPADRARELLATTTHNGFPWWTRAGDSSAWYPLATLRVVTRGEARGTARARARRALDAHMRVAHLRRAPMPRPILPRGTAPRSGRVASAARARSDYPSKRSRDTWRANRDISARRRSEEVASRRSSERRRRRRRRRERGGAGRVRPSIAAPGVGARERRSGPSSVRAGSAGRGPSAARGVRGGGSDAEEMANAAGGCPPRPDDNGAIGAPRTAWARPRSPRWTVRARKREKIRWTSGRSCTPRRSPQAELLRRRGCTAAFTSAGRGESAVTDATNRVGIITRRTSCAPPRTSGGDEAPSRCERAPGSPLVFHPPAASFGSNRRARVSRRRIVQHK